MIIPNGTIRFKVKSGGGIDPVTGHAQKPTSSWGEPIPCQYTANSYNRLARVMGEASTQQSYEILIEEQHIPSEQLKLTDDRAGEVGDFSIRQVEPLNAVCEMRILV